MKVQTKRGILNIDEVFFQNIVTITDTSMNIATIWRSKLDHEIVRQDAYVNMLVGLSMNSEQSEI